MRRLNGITIYTTDANTYEYYLTKIKIKKHFLTYQDHVSIGVI